MQNLLSNAKVTIINLNKELTTFKESNKKQTEIIDIQHDDLKNMELFKDEMRKLKEINENHEANNKNNNIKHTNSIKYQETISTLNNELNSLMKINNDQMSLINNQKNDLSKMESLTEDMNNLKYLNKK